MSTTNQATRKALAKIESMLAMVVGVQKMHYVSIDDFLVHAQNEIAKAASEPVEKSNVRLSLLYKSVLYTSDVIENAESDAIKVPVYVCDQTTLGEQENNLFTPEKAASMNPSKGTFFEGGADGMKKFMEQIGEQMATLKASVEKLGDMPEDDDAQGKKKGKKPEGAEDTEKLDDSSFLFVGKAKDGGKPPRKFPFKGPDGEVDTDKLRAATKAIDEDKELSDEEKSKLKTKAQRMLDAKKKVGKGLSAGEVAWPDDMNDATFVEKGHQADSDWGSDDRPL